jgi:elongation factor 3
MMEGKVSKVLEWEFRQLGVQLEESEKEYITSAVTSILDDRRRLALSQLLAKEIAHEIVEVIEPTLMENTDSLGNDKIMRVVGALMTTYFPDSLKLLFPESSDSSGQAEIPLLDFPDLTLAYMGLELLRHTSVTIYRGHIYGIIGKNGIGKTTLLNKLASGEIPGFPKNVRCGIVRHELVGKFDRNTPREIINNPEILSQVGFSGKDLSLADIPCSDLSGGWRMRTSIGSTIAAGDLDLLLMDEPTNHLDRECVEWLIGFLKSQRKLATIVISHDEEFLDKSVDFIIYFYNYRLKTIRSNFSDFIKSELLDPTTLVPLSSPDDVITPPVLPMLLPKPGSLDGVRSTTQTIAKLEDVSFTYPSSGPRIAGVSNVTGRVSLCSRISLVGPNGAGKSTIASLLVGSLTPDSGIVYRHPNLRVAFVSQHHVHHLEEFLDKTCMDYFVDRFGSGLDKEVMELKSIKETGYEQLDRVAKAKKFADQCGGRSGHGGVERLLGRRKEGREYAYEVQWIGVRSDLTDWLPRSVLENDLGVGKLCSALDAIIAQKKANTDQRALDFKSIKEYLKNFGILDHTAEGKIAGLSGGQKSRLTLAAAMWTYPHLLILDEPTNYLDSASLDTLLDAVSNFQGAVIVISHNAPFVDRFSKDCWVVEGGKIIDRIYPENDDL